MAKPKNYAAKNMLKRDDSGDDVTLDPDKSLSVQADGVTFGTVDISERERVQAVALPLDEIFPDLRQPRRAIPASVRGQWAGNPADIPGLLQLWHKSARMYAGTPLDLAVLLNGIGDGVDMRSDEPVLRDYLELVGLAASIRKDGLTNPVTVTRQVQHYLLDTGERRYLAHWMLRQYMDEKWGRILARIVDSSDVWRQASENGVRKPLNAIGMARQLALLIMDLYQGDDGVKFQTYEHLLKHGVSDREFYSQVGNGRIFPIKRGTSGRILQVTGLNSRDQIAQYRALLNISDELWLQADVENWAEGKIRELINGSESDDVPTIVGTSEGDTSATVDIPEGDTAKEDSRLAWWKGKQVTWQVDGETLRGEVRMVYKASSLPRPGAVMLQVEDKQGRYHQVEAENARLLEHTDSASNPVGYTVGDSVIVTGKGAFGEGKSGVVQEVGEKILVNLLSDNGRPTAAIAHYAPKQLTYARLPEAQEKMLLQTYRGDPIDPKNAATRQALREKGMIFITSSSMWFQALMNKGYAYLDQYGLRQEVLDDDEADELDETEDTPPAAADNQHSARTDDPDRPIAVDDRVWIKSSIKGEKDENLNILWTVESINGQQLARLWALNEHEQMMRANAYIWNLRRDDTAVPPEPEQPEDETVETEEDLPPAALVDHIEYNGQTWRVGNRIYSADGTGIIESILVHDDAVYINYDFENQDPPGLVSMQGAIAELSLTPPDLDGLSRETIVRPRSADGIMLSGIQETARSLSNAGLPGAVARLLDASPAEIARFVHINGAARYTQMLQRDSEILRAYLSDCIEAVNEVCQRIWETAQAIEQQHNSGE